MCLLKRTAVEKKRGGWRDYRDLIILIAIVSEVGSSSGVGNHRLYFSFTENVWSLAGLDHGGRVWDEKGTRMGENSTQDR